MWEWVYPATSFCVTFFSWGKPTPTFQSRAVVFPLAHARSPRWGTSSISAGLSSRIPSVGLAAPGQLAFDSPRYRSYFLREVVGLMSSIVMMISRETQLLSARLQLCRLVAA